MTRFRALAPALIAIPLLLVGCSFSSNLTTSAASVAEQAAQALQDQLGTDTAPEIDCGEEAIDLLDGTVVDCLLTDPSSGLEYDTTVTLSDVDGSNFHIDVQVAETANNASDVEEEPTSDLTVTSDALAELAAGALEPELGYRPEISCSAADVPVVVDENIRCMIADEAGATSTVLITITEVDGTDYSINAQVQ